MADLLPGLKRPSLSTGMLLPAHLAQSIRQDIEMRLSNKKDRRLESGKTPFLGGKALFRREL